MAIPQAATLCKHADEAFAAGELPADAWADDRLQHVALNNNLLQVMALHLQVPAGCKALDKLVPALTNTGPEGLADMAVHEILSCLLLQGTLPREVAQLGMQDAISIKLSFNSFQGV